MEPRNPMLNPQDITTDLVRERTADAIRARCGPGKPMSVDALVEATGLDRRTIEAYRRGEATPCLSKLLRLVAVLGPSLLNDVLALAGLGGAERLGGAGQPDSYGLNAELAQAVGMMGRHLQDGRFDHREMAEQREMVGHMQDLLGRWVASYDRSQGCAPAGGGNVSTLHRDVG